MDKAVGEVIMTLGMQEVGTHLHVWEDGECVAILRKVSIVEWVNIASDYLMKVDHIATAMVRSGAGWVVT